MIMNTRNLNTSVKIIAVFFLAGIVFFSCSFNNPEFGTLVVKLPGSGAVKGVYDTVSDEFLSKLRYEIVCTGSRTVTESFRYGQNASVSLSPGEWNISVTVHIVGSPKVIGEGENFTVTIEAGKITAKDDLLIGIDTWHCDITSFSVNISGSVVEIKDLQGGNAGVIIISVPFGWTPGNQPVTFNATHEGVSMYPPPGPLSPFNIGPVDVLFEVTAESGDIKPYNLTVEELPPPGNFYLGKTMTLAGQVYEWHFDWYTGQTTETPYTGTDDVYSASPGGISLGGNGKITNGNLNFTISEPPLFNYLIDEAPLLFGGGDEEGEGIDFFTDFKVEPDNTRAAALMLFIMKEGDEIQLSRMRENFGGGSMTSGTYEGVGYIYVDQNANLTATGVNYLDDIPVTIPDLNLNLRTGWNAIYYREEINWLHETIGVTVTLGNPENLRWVLSSGYNIEEPGTYNEWPSPAIWASYGLEGIQQPYGTRVEYANNNFGYLHVMLGNADQGHFEDLRDYFKYNTAGVNYTDDYSEFSRFYSYQGREYMLALNISEGVISIYINRGETIRDFLIIDKGTLVTGEAWHPDDINLLNPDEKHLYNFTAQSGRLYYIEWVDWDVNNNYADIVVGIRREGQTEYIEELIDISNRTEICCSYSFTADFSGQTIIEVCGIVYNESGSYRIRVIESDPNVLAAVYKESLTLGEAWHIDVLHPFKEHIYSFTAQSGRNYRVEWVDADSISGDNYADILVSARMSGETTLLFGPTDGTEGLNFYYYLFPENTTGQVDVVVQGFSGSSYGMYKIRVIDTEAGTAPVISVSGPPPQPIDLADGDTSSLSVTAVVIPDTAELTYQWYISSSPANTGGTPISGATSSMLTVPISSHTTGTMYYYCLVSASGATPMPSNPAAVTITPATEPTEQGVWPTSEWADFDLAEMAFAQPSGTTVDLSSPFDDGSADLFVSLGNATTISITSLQASIESIIGDGKGEEIEDETMTFTFGIIYSYSVQNRDYNLMMALSGSNLIIGVVRLYWPENSVWEIFGLSGLVQPAGTSLGQVDVGEDGVHIWLKNADEGSLDYLKDFFKEVCGEDLELISNPGGSRYYGSYSFGGQEYIVNLETFIDSPFGNLMFGIFPFEIIDP